MTHQVFRAVSVFIVALGFILQYIPEVESKGSSGGSRGTGGRGSSISGGGSRYTSKSSSKSFVGKAVAFGAGVYIGYNAVKIAKKVRLGASLVILYTAVIF